MGEPIAAEYSETPSPEDLIGFGFALADVELLSYIRIYPQFAPEGAYEEYLHMLDHALKEYVKAIAPPDLFAEMYAFYEAMKQAPVGSEEWDDNRIALDGALNGALIGAASKMRPELCAYVS